MPSEDALPEGWIRSTLGEACERTQYGWTTKAAPNASGVRFLRTTDISSGKIDWGSVPGCQVAPSDLEKYLLHPGDIVVSRAGSVGVSWLITDCPRAVFASYLIRLRPCASVNGHFVALFMRTPNYWSQVAGEAVGIALPNVNASKLRELVLPLPPLAEQKRIVAMVEKLLARIDAARARLDRVPAILKRFRQAVLAAACSGRLTEEWRAETPGTPADQLLSEMAPDVLAGRMRRRKSAADHLSEEPFELPNSWSWASVADVCTSVTDGDHQPPPKASAGVPFVVISNVRHGRVDLGNTMFVPREYFAALSPERRPAVDDVLYTVTGSYGIPVLVREEAEFCFQRHIALLRGHRRMSGAYVCHALATLNAYEQATAVATGIAQLTVPLSGLRMLRIPVPPEAEQREIVRRVQSLFTLADTIEQHVAAATARAGKLKQSVLAKAFRGELVPTEAELARREGRSYETATELLERIRGEREAAGPAPKRCRYTSERS